MKDTSTSMPTTVQPPPKAGPSRIGIILTFAFVIGLLVLLGFGLAKANKGPRESGLAPDFTLIGFDGQKVTLSELRGQVVIINFWASWCLPCRQEAPYLEQTWRKYKERGVVFIGIDYVDTEQAALAYLKEFDITYINGPDLGTRISQSYNIKGVPETYFVAKNGELRGVQLGPMEAPQLDQKIDALLSEPYPEQTP